MAISNIENNFLNAIRAYLAAGRSGVDLALRVMEKMPEGSGKNSAYGLLSKYYLECDKYGEALAFALQMTSGEEKDVALADYINGQLDARNPAGSANMYQYLVLMNHGTVKDGVIQKFTECAHRTCDVAKVVAAISMVSSPEARFAWQERYFQNAIAANCPVRATRMLAELGRKPRSHERRKLFAIILEHGGLEDFGCASVLCDRLGPSNDELNVLATKAAERLELNRALEAIKLMLPGPLRNHASWLVVNAFRKLDYHQFEFINAELEVISLLPEEERGKAYAVIMEKCVSKGMVAMGSRVAAARGKAFTDTEIEQFIAVNRRRNGRYDDDDLRLVNEMTNQESKVALAEQLLAFFIERGRLLAAQAAAEIRGKALGDDLIMTMIRKRHYDHEQVVFGLSLLRKKLSQAEMDELLLGEIPSR